MRAVEVLRRRFALEQQVSAPQSATGPALARARGEDPGVVNLGQESVRERLALLTLLCRDLTAEEEAVCRVRLLGCGGHDQVERCVPTADLVAAQLLPELLPTRLTLDGDEEVGAARDEHGDPRPGWRLVAGLRARRPSWAEVGAELRCESWRARSAFDRAVGKVASRLRRVFEGEGAELTEMGCLG